MSIYSSLLKQIAHVPARYKAKHFRRQIIKHLVLFRDTIPVSKYFCI